MKPSKNPFFGRAGRIDPPVEIKLSPDVGISVFHWASVAPANTDGSNLYFRATVMHPSYSNHRAYGYSLRCLAHGTAG